ncbi:RNA ligase family protein [Streptomyces umbrinus]|uniref:RNA ligase family protein n=1 Tax=Streptomyces umbrinus TaxID=67370 RepID=UPI0034381F0E
MHEFTPWPKTKRLFRDIVITEKLDGTNSAIHISAGYEVRHPEFFELKPGEVIVDGRLWRLSAQSRKRIITPGKTTDNYAFAAWVYDNAAELVTILGEGTHFGEWWGSGIQRGYDMPGKVFSLFNTERWFRTGDDGLDSMATRAELSSLAGQVRAVPVIYSGVFSEARINHALLSLKTHGSHAAPGFMDAEGICIFHTQTRSVMKVTLDANDAGKWEAAA